MDWYEHKFEFISNVNSGNIGDNIILQRREQGKDVEHFVSLQNPIFLCSIPSFCCLIILYINFYSHYWFRFRFLHCWSLCCILLLIFIV